MITVSLCMIVKNEEDVLARCLDSVRDAVDEIIVVDTGSTDHTREIALRYTRKVYNFAWIDDFAEARNFSFSKASMDYCMWLDADDVLEAADRDALIALKECLPPDTDVIMMPYHTAFDEQNVPTFSYYRERLLRRSAGFLWQGAVHEAITPRGNIVYSSVAVCHRKIRPSDPDRNLRIFEKLLTDGQSLEPRQQFYYARELYYHQRYADAIRILESYLDSSTGWVENEIEACRYLAFCKEESGDASGSMQALFRSFSLDLPRAEICCEIGERFLRCGRYDVAAYWYQRALECPYHPQSGGFVLPDCYGYIPCMQLCVCYDRLGDHELAFQYNERAAQYKPDADAVRYNRAYFAQLDTMNEVSD